MQVYGGVLQSGRNGEDFISRTTVEQYLREFPNNSHFTIVSKGVTIEEVLAFFNNDRKLASIIITSDGTAGGKLMGIITAADIMDLMKVLEGF